MEEQGAGRRDEAEGSRRKDGELRRRQALEGAMNQATQALNEE